MQQELEHSVTFSLPDVKNGSEWLFRIFINRNSVWWQYSRKSIIDSNKYYSIYLLMSAKLRSCSGFDKNIKFFPDKKKLMCNTFSFGYIFIRKKIEIRSDLLTSLNCSDLWKFCFDLKILSHLIKKNQILKELFLRSEKLVKLRSNYQKSIFVVLLL